MTKKLSEAFSSSTSGSCHSRVPSSHHRNASSSNCWSIVKNVRDLTTGSLDLGALPVCVSHNSANKLETGLLLTGVIEESVRFKITTLIILKQKGISDIGKFKLSSQTISYCFLDPYTLTLDFLSFTSVDLHQLFDFQKDKPSAVYIVVAPAHMPSNVPAQRGSAGITTISFTNLTGNLILRGARVPSNDFVSCIADT